MDIHFATSNARKVRSLQKDLAQYGFNVVHHPVDLIEPRASDIQEIARVKMLQAYPQIEAPTIVIDAGFFVHSIRGFPRAYVNFALETVDLEGILRLVDGKDRACEFRECLAYQAPGMSEPHYVSATIPGTVAPKELGFTRPRSWSRLDLIFIPDGSDLTLAQMEDDQYQEWRKEARKDNSLGYQLSQYLDST
ncbi:non-canonical purine NTP pyrophosphatase [Nanoarchaeota archaeon]